MSHIARRDFLATTASAAAVSSVWPASVFAQKKQEKLQSAQETAGPDFIVTGATVYTVDRRQPTAEAFAVKNGTFVAVGSNKEIQALKTAGTKIIDAAGTTIVPGFIDSHTHPASGGSSELMFVNCDKRSIAEIVEAIRARAAKTPKGEMIRGFKFDDTKLKDDRPLSRKDLDAATSDHPVRITHRGGHTSYCNSLTLKKAGIDKNTKDPQGGKFGRDANGELNGFAAETADDLIVKVFPSSPITPKQYQQGVALMSQLMAASGLTSVHDTGTKHDYFNAYRDCYAADELKFRVYAVVLRDLYEDLVKTGVRTGFGDDMLKIGALKLSIDGSASERTMRMSTPYVGRPNDYGLLTMQPDVYNRIVQEAHNNGFQLATHANGDVAIDIVLNAYSLAQRLTPRRDPRFRIEHCTLINEDLLRRIKKLGAIPTPFYTYVHYHGNKWVSYGEEKLKSMFAHRSFLDHNIPVAGASDYTPGPFEPLMAIQSMVTRKDFQGRVWGPNQKVTVDEALTICTINGAYASYEEKVKGSITPGKFADFVMLAKDPHKVDPDTIKKIPVVRTVLGGKTTHEA